MLLITPASFMQLLFAAEDPQMPFYFIMPWRILRMVGFILSVFLPGFYITLLSFHQDQIPFRCWQPWQTPGSGFLFQQGLRCSSSCFCSACCEKPACRCLLPSRQPLRLYPVSLSATRPFGAVSFPDVDGDWCTFLRCGLHPLQPGFCCHADDPSLFVLTISSMFGLFGFFISLFLIVQYAANHNPFGQPYLAPFSPFSISKIIGNLMRFPGKRKGWRAMKRILMLLSMLSLLLSGCWDNKEVQDINYITALGIDYKDNKYIIYVQMLDFATIAKQESRSQLKSANLGRPRNRHHID